MAPFGPPPPTPMELEILRVLWQLGPSTVRDVHEVLNQAKPTGYTTVLKLLQIMTVKGMVRRDEAERAHIYEAAQAAEQTKRRLVRDLLDKAFAGSASELTMHALAGKKESRQQIEEIRRMLDEYEKDTK
jgi:BlaI family transcriptional regulator, penicillinase repressor